MKNNSFLYILLIALFTVACQKSTPRGTGASNTATKKEAKKVIHRTELKKTKSKTALYFDSIGLINIAEADSSIAVHLMYASADNFTGQVLYTDLKEAYLHPDAAEALLSAQQNLKRIHPQYSLIIYDAVRPMAIQQKMWDVVKGSSRDIYVSNPAHGGGLHNYGVAVDISIIDSLGNPLSMGTEVDHLGIEAHISNEAQLVATGKMTRKEQENRRLLRLVMKKAGFRTLPTEWWHFNLCNRSVAKQKYKLIQ